MRNTLIHQALRLIQLGVLPLTLLLIVISKNSPHLVDWLYSGRLYPFFSNLIGSVTKGLPFSAAEFILYALIIAAVVLLIVRVIRLILFKKKALVKLVSLAVTIVLTASYLVFLFYLLWGFNFYRTPIDKRLDLPVREYTVDELYKLCEKLADDAAELRDELDEDENGVFACTPEQAFGAVVSAYTLYGASHELFSRDPVPAKRVAWSRLLSGMNITGVFSCYTAEPNVNCEQPSVYLAFTAAHETAHYYGWAKEDQASFIAYMVCSDSDEPAAAYSAAMHALSNCASSLYSKDKAAYERLTAHYTGAMKRDLEAYSKYYNKYKGSKAGELNDKVNDAYLKLNGQESGIIAYGEDVELLLRYYDARGFFRS